jgi:hypothetical protein
VTVQYVEEETLELHHTDYLRFLTASAGRRIVTVDELALTSQFLPFALPSWGIVGAQDLPTDGASSAAVPGLTERVERIMGLGQQTDILEPTVRDRSPLTLRRLGRLEGDEIKHGSSGPFRLLTVVRDVYVSDRVVAKQREYFAVGR